MSNQAVYVNISVLTVTPHGESAVNVTSVRSISVNDNTGEIVAGSDNDASPKKFNSWKSFQGQLVCEDGSEATKVAGKNNCAVVFTAVNINTGSNATVTMAGVRFAQAGTTSEYGQQALPTVPCSGGTIVWS